MHAALSVFERQGIAATSIEDIVAEAGYTRGAFYSSFDSIDDLVLSVIDQHVDYSMKQLVTLTEEYSSPEDFVAELARRGGGQAVAPPGATRVLSVELNLYALRNPSNRERLAERLQRMRSTIGAVIERQYAAAGLTPSLPPEEFAAMIMAMDDGLAMHAMLEPDFYPPDTFFRWIAALRPPAQ